MKIAFHLHAVRSHFAAAMPTSLEQAAAFDWIAERGFDGVDISDSWGFDQVDAAAAKVTRELLAARGLVVGTMSCMGKTLCHPEIGGGDEVAKVAKVHRQMITRGYRLAKHCHWTPGALAANMHQCPP